MRICLLTNQDLNDLPDDDWPCDPRPYLPDATWELAVLEKTNAVEQVIALSRRRFDVYFNLCDGSWDEEDNPGVEVVKTLEKLDVPFTGGTSDFYEPSREATKRACRALGIDTPAYVMARTEADVRRAAEELRFPLFVKHPSSYASIGLTRDSKVGNPKALLKQARIMLKAYGGALIEEFIEGLECTVLVAENPDDPDDPIVYQPIQFRFPEGESFKHSDMKWVIYEDLDSGTVQDEEMDAKLRDVSARLFLKLNGTGYGRCDLRVDSEGRAFMLEINANCGLFYPPADASSADFCLQADPDGHEGFTRLIIDAAIKRHARNSPAWEVRPRSENRHGVFARRPIRKNQRILLAEGRPHRLVTRSHAAEHWNSQQLEFFRRTAWPVTEELFVAWSQEPDEWTPFGHSCNPNAWLEGLDVAARRRIKKGEEITLDYATFHNEQMPDFECDCDGPDCRGTIRGDDYLQNFVEAYGDHVSDYVKSKRGGHNT
ncbi:MAG: SET domain-containing protein-lysine N-methyltransferase [bacterium]|nr:SET domain-containing protein-lysine N-methyltransferase [bacterium]